MIIQFALMMSMMISTMLTGSDAYLGDDMTDEDFESFADSHADMLESVGDFVKDNRAHFEAAATGAINGVTALALKGVMPSNPIAGTIIASGGVELVKNIYKNTVSGSSSKEDRIGELERKLESVLKEINEIKAGNYNQPTLGDFTSGHGHETRDQNSGSSDPRTSVYSIGSNTYTTDPREAGPHRDGYRQHRDPSTREIRDRIDRIVRDATRADTNYVERKD